MGRFNEGQGPVAASASSGFAPSGRQAPQGESAAMPVPREEALASPENGIKLSQEDLAQMGELCRREDDALKRLGEISLILSRVQADVAAASAAAATAREARDKFCMSIEQKYAVPKGRRWRMDFKNGWVQFI